MDSLFSLLAGQHRHHVVNQATEYVETTHFPSALSKAIEELLIRQVSHTVNQVEHLLINEGYVISQLAIEAKKLIS